jgi:predicted outer membrane repeat protein
MRARATKGALAALLLLGTLAGVTVLGSAPASAGGPVAIVVTVDADVVDGNTTPGNISLREAVNLSNADGFPNTILLGVAQTYQLTECAELGSEDEDLNADGDLDLLDGEDLEIRGNGSEIVQTCGGERIFQKLGTGTLDLNSVGISGGTSGDEGGGVYVGTDLVLRGSTSLHDNSAFQGGGAWAGGTVDMELAEVRDNVSSSGGGGIFTLSTMEIDRSSFSGNSTSSGGGAIFAGDDVAITNSTITGNMAANNGGVSVQGAAIVRYSTIVANGSRDGFGGANLNANIDSVVESSIIALGGNGDDCSNGSFYESLGNNVGSDGTCGFSDASDLSGVYPHLVTAPQPEVGGVVHRPVQQSLAIDVETPPCGVAIDQSGTNRPLGTGCEAGADEIVAPACAVGFSDVSASHPFFEDICWMDQTLITTGFPDDTFKPSAPVTRQSMAAFIYRLAMSPPFELPVSPTFGDVSPAHPFYDEIEWMAWKGIASGFDGDVYLPAANVSRQAMSAFMYRVAGEPLFIDPAEQTFDDVSPAHPFFHEIEWMAEEEISTGFLPGPQYRPSIAVSRQAMSAFMLRLAESVPLDGL